MADLLLLLGVSWRHAQAAIRYPLRAGGYPADARSWTQRLHGALLLAAFAGLVVLGCAQALTFAVGLSTLLRAAGALRAAAAALPGTVFGLQIAAVAASAPPALAAPFGPAGPPVRRGALAALSLAGQAARAWPPWALAAAVAAAVLAGTARPAAVTALAALPLCLQALGAAWLVGLGRRAWAPGAGSGPAPRVLGSRLGPVVLLIAAAVVLPQALLWPGRVLLQLSLGTAPASALGALWAVGMAAFVAAVLAVAASRLALQDPGDDRPIRAPRPSLPAASGTRLLALRAALSYVRRPGRAAALGLDFAFALSGCVLLAAPLPSRPWLCWVLLLALWRPRGIADGFAADAERPFLRRLLPHGLLALLIGDAVLPAAAVCAAVLAAWLALRPTGSATLLGALFVPVLLALRALAQALAPPPSAPGRWRPAFGPVAGIAFGMLMGVGAGWQRPLPALLLGLALAAGMGFVLAQEP